MDNTENIRDSGKHFSNVDIGNILGLNKGKESQRQNAKFIKCSQKAIQNILANYHLETCQGCGLWYTYQ